MTQDNNPDRQDQNVDMEDALQSCKPESRDTAEQEGTTVEPENSTAISDAKKGQDADAAVSRPSPGNASLKSETTETGAVLTDEDSAVPESERIPAVSERQKGPEDELPEVDQDPQPGSPSEVEAPHRKSADTPESAKESEDAARHGQSAVREKNGKEEPDTEEELDEGDLDEITDVPTSCKPESPDAAEQDEVAVEPENSTSIADDQKDQGVSAAVLQQPSPEHASLEAKTKTSAVLTDEDSAVDGNPESERIPAVSERQKDLEDELLKAALQEENREDEPSSEEERDEGDLDEMTFDPVADDSTSTLNVGTTHIVGDVHYVVKDCLPRGYYRGQKENDDEAPTVLFLMESQSDAHAFWAEMKQEREDGLVHPRLPRIKYASEDGIVLEEVEGDPIQTKLPLHEAVSRLHGVCQLMLFLAMKNMAVTDIDLSGLVVTKEQELKLRYLPTVVPMGEPACVRFGDGATPLIGSPEHASQKTSLFLWGAMLYTLVTGNDDLAEKDIVDVVASGSIQKPGMPQLLRAAMIGLHECEDPLRTLMSLYSDYKSPAIPQCQYQLGAATTVGLNPTRICNEDSYGIAHNLEEYHDAQVRLLRACVADGMGGEEAGEVASQAAVDAFCHHPLPKRWKSPEEQAQWTRELGWNANEAVIKKTGDTRGGCTLSGIVIEGNRLTLAHVGDSRIYLYSREKDLRQLSRDHSLVQAMLDSGNMTEDEAAASPDTNQILRALGTAGRDGQDDGFVDSLSSRKDPEGKALYEQDWLTLAEGEMVLLMSDGIWGVWEYRESVITRELTQVIEDESLDLDPQRIADALVEAALDEGADDNATVVVVKRTR